MKKLTTEEFIQKAQQVHSRRYTYYPDTYVSSSTPLDIVCSRHGDFSQRPNDHLNGQGCPHCGKESMANHKRKKREHFIEQATDLHGDIYDYSNVEYINTHTKVEIGCPTHGSFSQKPNSHLSQRNGCPKCARLKHPGRYTAAFFGCQGNKIIPGKFYIIEFSHKDEVFIKVGITTMSVEGRYAGKRGKYKMKIVQEQSMTLHEAFIKEQSLLEKFSYLKYKPKHKLEGHTECFNLDIVPLID